MDRRARIAASEDLAIRPETLFMLAASVNPLFACSDFELF